MAVKFSVIVPVYNIENYIEKAVISILAQTYKSWELILIDDGSFDSSGRICDQYAQNHANIQVVHKKNGGLSDARNVGIDKAVGEYLLFLDGDDYIAKWTLEKLRDTADTDKCDMVLSEGFYIVSDSGQTELKRYFQKEDIQKIRGEQALEITSKIRSNWSAWGKCYSRKFWQKYRFQFICNRLAEDFQLIDRVLLKAKRVTMVPAFYYYCQRNNSIMHQVNTKLLQDMLLNFHDWEVFFQNNKIRPVLRKQLYARYAAELCHVLMGYVSFIKDKEEKAWMIGQIKNYLFYLRYNRSMECRMIAFSIRLIGLKHTCCLIGMIKRVRLRKSL